MLRSVLIQFFSVFFLANSFSQGDHFSITLPDFESLWGRTVLEVEDQNILVVGTSEIDNFQSISLKKVDSSGSLIWQKSIHQFGFDLYNDGSGSTIPTSDGKFVTAGASLHEDENYFYDYRGDAMLVKFSPEGDTIWLKKFVDENFSLAYRVAETSDKGFILVGYQAAPFPNQERDALIIKTDSTGNLVWKTVYGGSGLLIDIANSVFEDQDGNFIVGFGKDLNLFNPNPLYKTQVIKLNELGDIVFEETLGNGCGAIIKPLRIGDGFLLLACRDTTINEIFIENVHFIRKMNEDFELIWEKSFVDFIETHPSGFKVQENDDFIVYGIVKEVQSDVYGWIAHFDDGGNLRWQNIYYTNPDFNNYILDISTHSDGGIIATGSARTEDLTQSLWVLKVDSIGCLIPNCNSTITIVESPSHIAPKLDVFPNPAKDFITIDTPKSINISTLQVFDTMGKLMNKTQLLGLDPVQVNISELPPGTYLINVFFQDQRNLVGKFFKVD